MPMIGAGVNGTDVLLLADVGGEQTPVGSQRDVTFEETSETIDVSSKESRAQRVLPGRYASTVSMEHLYIPDDTAHKALQDANRNGTFITVRRSEFGTQTEESSAVVTSVSGEYPDQGESVISLEMTVDGLWMAV